MASFRKRGKTWTYIVEGPRDPVTNERNQIPKGGFRTKKEAEEAARILEVQIQNGTYVKEQKVSFREYSTRWKRLYAAGVVSVKKPKKPSIRQRDFQVGSLLEYFDAVCISKITSHQYQDVLLDLIEKMERNTVVGIHGVARMIFRRAMQDGIIKVDPTEYAKVPRTDDEEEEVPKYFEKEQLGEFLQLAKSRGIDDDFPIFLILAYTGMRIGELCVLKWNDVDFENRTISINGTLYNPESLSNTYEIMTPKTKSSRRTIDVDQVVMTELERLRAVQNEFKMLHRKTYHDAGFVFGRRDKPTNMVEPPYGYPPKVRNIEYHMKRITSWMNLPFRVTPHTLRHTHASLLAEAGASLEAIQERLGHKDDKITRLVYTHVTKTVKRRTSLLFEALMDETVSSVVKM